MALTVQPSRTSLPRTAPPAWRLDVRVPPRALAVFTRQLATMYRAGVPVAAAIEALAHQTEDFRLTFVLLGVHWELMKGRSLSASLAPFPGVFTPIYVAFVREGESLGDFSQCLDEVADFLDADWQLVQKVTAALLYPAIVLAAGLGVGVLSMRLLLPLFAELFADAGPLPWTSQVLVALGTLATHGAVLAGLGAALGLLALLGARRAATPAGRLERDRVLLRLPVAGRLVRQVALSRIGRCMGLCLEAGLPMLSVLQLCSEVAGNEVFRADLLAAREAVRKGSSLAKYFVRRKALYTRVFVNLIAIGEHACQLDRMAQKIAALMDLSTEETLGVLLRLVEPVLLLASGAFVGFMALAAYQPLYGLLGHIN